MALSAAESAREYINSHSVLCLATTRGSQPWVAPVFYAVWRSTVVFLSAPHTRHCRNMSENPLVSGSIQEDYSDWKSIRGVQLEAVASRVEADCLDDVIACYSRKFPVTGPAAPAEIVKALDKIAWYQLTPSLVYFIDNSKGLGHREDVTLSMADY